MKNRGISINFFYIILVGLAIAGVGGVASSKPVATAVVGPGGLAVGKNLKILIS